MDVVGAIGGAAGAAAWTVAGTRLVSRLRPARQMTAFTVGVIACALTGGLIGSAITITGYGDSAVSPVVRTVAVNEPDPSGVIPPPPTPDPTATTAPEPSTTVTGARAHTATTAATRHRTRRRRARRAPAPQPVTARCVDGWGIYGRNATTSACNSHGGIDHWIIDPTK